MMNQAKGSESGRWLALKTVMDRIESEGSKMEHAAKIIVSSLSEGNAIVLHRLLGEELGIHPKLAKDDEIVSGDELMKSIKSICSR